VRRGLFFCFCCRGCGCELIGFSNGVVVVFDGVSTADAASPASGPYSPAPAHF
jgi:hypothetical protein